MFIYYVPVWLPAAAAASDWARAFDQQQQLNLLKAVHNKFTVKSRSNTQLRYTPWPTLRLIFPPI